MDFLTVIIAIIALVVGSITGWFAHSARASSAAAVAAEARVEAERRLAAGEARHEAFNEQSRVAAAQWDRERLDLQQRLATLETALNQMREAKAHADSEAAALEAKLQQQESANTQLSRALQEEKSEAARRIEEVKADQQRLRGMFAELSAEALTKNTETFLKQAEQRLVRANESGANILKQREDAVKALVEPLTQALGQVKNEVSEAEKRRIASQAALNEQVSAMQRASLELRDETSQLVTALRAPQVRGQWGEMQLRRVVEAAGMVQHVDFNEQQSTTDSDGNLQRPDMVVHLPGDKQVIVDSKVAFGGYLESMEARDDQQRRDRLKAHARHMRRHIEDLSGKKYWDLLEVSPEFVIMFVPADTFLTAALEQDPTLLEHAFGKNVVIATPATLVALLRTIAYTWRQERLAQDAQQVFTVGQELYKRLGTMGTHLNTLGKKLNDTVTAYNKLNRSVDSQLVTGAKRFAELQGLDESKVTLEPEIAQLANPAAKPELFTEPSPGASLEAPAIRDLSDHNTTQPPAPSELPVSPSSPPAPQSNAERGIGM